ncbi:MAG: DUF2306 domain-containing protein [Chloroflexota bacterium]
MTIDRKHLPSNTWADTLLRRITTTLVTTIWISAIIFGLYILLYYLNSWLGGELSRWNEGVSELYAEDDPLATGGMGIHFIGGTVLLFFGTIQFIERLRLRYPVIHRWLGRIYIASSLATAIGGLLYIFTHGTVGGTVMDVGFALYGLVMMVAAVETIRHARARRYERHRIWALRLYLLVIASWLYRMEYGFWYLFTGGAGSTPNLIGPFDQVMAFFFYIPNLLLLEFFLRAKEPRTSTPIKVFASVMLVIITGGLVIMTLGFMAQEWGPAIAGTETQ